MLPPATTGRLYGGTKTRNSSRRDASPRRRRKPSPVARAGRYSAQADLIDRFENQLRASFPREFSGTVGGLLAQTISSDVKPNASKRSWNRGCPQRRAMKVSLKAGTTTEDTAGECLSNEAPAFLFRRDLGLRYARRASPASGASRVDVSATAQCRHRRQRPVRPPSVRGSARKILGDLRDHVNERPRVITSGPEAPGCC